jgi:hypothetical protein
LLKQIGREQHNNMTAQQRQQKGVLDGAYRAREVNGDMIADPAEKKKYAELLANATQEFWYRTNPVQMGGLGQDPAQVVKQMMQRDFPAQPPPNWPASIVGRPKGVEDIAVMQKAILEKYKSGALTQDQVREQAKILMQYDDWFKKQPGEQYQTNTGGTPAKGKKRQEPAPQPVAPPAIQVEGDNSGE